MGREKRSARGSRKCRHRFHCNSIEDVIEVAVAVSVTAATYCAFTFICQWKSQPGTVKLGLLQHWNYFRLYSALKVVLYFRYDVAGGVCSVTNKNESTIINGQICYVCKNIFFPFRKIKYYLSWTGEAMQNRLWVTCYIYLIYKLT